MVDNVGITPGSGALISADEVVINGITVEVQRVKTGFGVDGTYSDVSSIAPLPVVDAGMGTPADAAYSGSGSGTVVAILKKLVAQFSAGFTLSGSVALADAEGIKGQFGGIVTNAFGQFTRPNDVIPYSINDIVANNTTASSVAYGSIQVARVSLGSFRIDRLRLKAGGMTTGLSGVTMKVRLWGIAQPTYVNGDNSAYSATMGASAIYLGSFTGTFEQFTDNAVALMLPDTGFVRVKLTSGQVIFWDLQTLAAWTPQASKTFTLIAEAAVD